MSTSTLSAKDIAEHQLLAALKLWQEEDFLSALTLAGAAEEILGKRLRKIGRVPSFDQLKAEIIALAEKNGHKSPETDKLIGSLLNLSRNELKHYAGDDSISFDLRADAIEILGRAISNHHLLTGTVLTEAIQFWGDISDT